MHGKTKIFLLAASLLICVSTASALDSLYHDNQEIYDEITAWADSLPDFVLIDTIGYSQNDTLPIWAVKVSNNVQIDEDQATVLFIGNIHAEELFGTEMILSMIDDILVHRYANFPYRYADWMAGLEMWFIPTINPEGRQVVMDLLDLSYRKNKHDCNQNGVFDFVPGLGWDIDGVDLNRNFPLNWVKGDTFLQPGITEYYDYFRGFSPLSESETQAVWQLAEREKFSFSISWHEARQGGLSEQIFYPWNWYQGKYSPDSLLIKSVGSTMGSMIQTSSGTGTYTPSYTAGDKGNQHDSFYAYFGTNAYLIEAGPGIQSSYDVVEEIIADNMNGVSYMLNRAAGTGDEPLSQLTGKVTDANTGEALAAEVIIPQLNSAFLQPRICDSTYGRYRRYLMPGTYDLEVHMGGYEPYYATGITVNPSSARTRNVQMIPKPIYSFDGKVLSLESGNPIACTLYINGEDVSDTLFIDSNGEFDYALPAGNYELIFVADNKVVRFDYLTLDQSHYIEFELSDAEILFFDDFESGLGAWTEGGNDPDWGTEISDSLWDGSQVLSDKPYLLYDPNEINWIELASPLDLTDKTTAALSFDHWYYFEPGYDSCWVEASYDGGVNWEPISSGYWGQDIGWCKVYANLDDYCGLDNVSVRLIISTDQSMEEEGWRIDNFTIASADTVVGVEPQPELPVTHLLYALYPNPFNSDLSISLELPKTQKLTVSVWDIAGRQITEIYQGYLTQGNHRLSWQVNNNIPSGLYFVRIETDKAVKINKVLYLK